MFIYHDRPKPAKVKILQAKYCLIIVIEKNNIKIKITIKVCICLVNISTCEEDIFRENKCNSNAKLCESRESFH